MIREATLADVEQCLDLAERFHAQSIWSNIPFDKDTARLTVTNTIENQAGVIFLSKDGFIGAVLAPLLFNASHAIAYELFWFAGSTGQQLIKAYEQWADDNQAMPLMVCLEDENTETLSKYYKRRGYEPAERYFVKRR